MIRKLVQEFQRREKAFYMSFGNDISTPQGRRAARIHAHIVDHAWIRFLWTNMFRLGPGAWRSNQPGPRRFKRLKRLGIRSIINLRGATGYSSYLFEEEAARAAGITLYNHQIDARALCDADDYLGLLELFERAERPVLMHCKSGADRASLAAAFWMLTQEGATLAEARQQMSPKYIHFKWTRTGILDALLDAYEADQPMPLRDWLETRYDPAAITAAFQAKRGKG